MVIHFNYIIKTKKNENNNKLNFVMVKIGLFTQYTVSVRGISEYLQTFWIYCRINDAVELKVRKIFRKERKSSHPPLQP